MLFVAHIGIQFDCLIGDALFKEFSVNSAEAEKASCLPENSAIKSYSTMEYHEGNCLSFFFPVAIKNHCQ